MCAHAYMRARGSGRASADNGGEAADLPAPEGRPRATTRGRQGAEVDLSASPLARSLLTNFLLGGTAMQLQQQAQAALAEFAPAVSTNIEALASIGSCGKQPGNALRDLMRLRPPA